MIFNTSWRWTPLKKSIQVSLFVFHLYVLIMLIVSDYDYCLCILYDYDDCLLNLSLYSFTSKHAKGLLRGQLEAELLQRPLEFRHREDLRLFRSHFMSS